MEFGGYLDSGNVYCVACWLALREHPGESDEAWREFVAKHRYVKPEHRGYPNHHEQREMPKTVSGWIAYYDNVGDGDESDGLFT